MVFIAPKFIYMLLPVVAYISAGTLKFMFNFIKYKTNALQHIGLGGFPSTHTSIISSAFFCVLLTNDVGCAVHALSMAILLIVIIDAMDLRNRIGLIAKAVNMLFFLDGVERSEFNKLREKNGHSWFEVIGGLCVGFIVTYIAYFFINQVYGL